MSVERLVAIEPKSFAAYERAVAAAGAEVRPIGPEVRALIWTDYSQPQQLQVLLSENPQLEWVQLPFAGVDAFAEVLSHPVLFTCAKGSYAEPVAEHALALALSLARAIPERVRATSWGRKFAVSFYESQIVIVGAGGITDELLKFLKPYRAEITVVRKHPELECAGATRTVGLHQLDGYLPSADLVICAAALTSETAGLFDLQRFTRMKPEAYFVNVARGGHVVTADLVRALNEGLIAGAAVDVTDPEPLPDEHPLWRAPNVIITPHTADTKPMVERLFSIRIKANVEAFFSHKQFLGVVDPKLGY